MTGTMVGTIYTPTWNSDLGERALELYDTCMGRFKYCYVQWKKQKKVGYRLDHIDTQLRDMAILPDAPIRVHLSHFSDPYGLDDTSETRRVLELFNRYHNPFSILSKAGTKAARDFDLYVPGCRFGQTLTLDNDAHSKHWEPGCALPADRIAALKQAFDKGIDTLVSLEPVIESKQTLHLIEMTYDFVNHYYLGKLNHNPEIEKGINWFEYKADAKALLENLGADYTISDKLTSAAQMQR
jgi:DNA repair photolyase